MESRTTAPCCCCWCFCCCCFSSSASASAAPAAADDRRAAQPNASFFRSDGAELGWLVVGGCVVGCCVRRYDQKDAPSWQGMRERLRSDDAAASRLNRAMYSSPFHEWRFYALAYVVVSSGSVKSQRPLCWVFWFPRCPLAQASSWRLSGHDAASELFEAPLLRRCRGLRLVHRWQHLGCHVAFVSSACLRRR
jgi:hypothetical protein